MIAIGEYIGITEAERSQLKRKGMARGAGEEGRYEDALLILGSMLGEEMTARVAAEVYVTQAWAFAELNRFDESGTALEHAAPFIDEAVLRVQASFYHHRGWWHKENRRYDQALTDYAGGLICAEGLGDKEREGIAILNIAGVYLALGDIPQARINVERAIAIFSEARSTRLCQAYDTQAKIYLVEGKLEKALEFNNASLDQCENESWQSDFLELTEQIEIKLLTLLGVTTIEDLRALKVRMVKRALIKAGTLEGAGKLVGTNHKGIDSIIKSNRDELEPFRSPRTTRRRSIIKH